MLDFTIHRFRRSIEKMSSLCSANVLLWISLDWTASFIFRSLGSVASSLSFDTTLDNTCWRRMGLETSPGPTQLNFAHWKILYFRRTLVEMINAKPGVDFARVYYLRSKISVLLQCEARTCRHNFFVQLGLFQSVWNENLMNEYNPGIRLFIFFLIN